MNYGLSDRVRMVAVEKYIDPAIQMGKDRVSVAVRDLMRDLAPLGFPTKNWPQICTAIQAEKFLREHDLEIEDVAGPPKKLSSTVVVTYRIRKDASNRAKKLDRSNQSMTTHTVSEDPDVWAERVTSKINGLLKNEIAECGGAEGFIRWVRSEDEDAA